MKQIITWSVKKLNYKIYSFIKQLCSMEQDDIKKEKYNTLDSSLAVDVLIRLFYQE